MMDVRNTLRITQTTASVCEVMGIRTPLNIDEANPAVMAKKKTVYANDPVERVLLYNPDAIALWLYQKYTDLFIPVMEHSELALPIQSVMPSVTPVCFASMYTGLMPKDHGIQAYVKPVLSCKTIFDLLIEAGKRPAIVSTAGDSISEIFLNREMDYFILDTPVEVNEKAEELLKADVYDLLVVYNGNFDAQMHETGPESDEAIEQLKQNVNAYARLCTLAESVWQNKRFMTAFLPDHGCHTMPSGLGNHGLDIDEDMNIIHFYHFGK